MNDMQPLQPLDLPCSGVRLIEASAGTGKTFTIATLYLRLLLEQERAVNEILVVTFTEAATEELRDRVRGRMREALAVLRGAADGDELLQGLAARLADREGAIARLTNELTRIDEAAIFTIHGFCQRVLQENAFESGTLFDIEFITDQSELLGEVIADFWRRTFYGDAGLAEVASNEWGTPAALAAAVRNYVGRRDLSIHPPPAPDDECRAAYREALAEARALWRSGRDAVIDLLESSKDLSRAKGSYKSEELAAAFETLDAFLAGDPHDYQRPAGFKLFTRAKLAASVTQAKRAKGIGPPEHPFFDACQALQDACARRIMGLFGEAVAFGRDELGRRKQQRGVLFFDDLLVNLSDALRGDGGAALAERIAGRFPVALIDEFQDTDPEQYRIFSTIYRGRPDGGLFMIGDPKQAIYSFRGADVFTYMAAKDGTVDGERFTLGTNWRSAAGLVQGVNTLFDACRAPFVYEGHIDFHPAAAAGLADDEPLRLDGATPTPLQAWFVPRSAENVDSRGRTPDLGKPIKKGWARERLSEASAEEIVRLLAKAAEGRALIGDRPLEPRDIAVLVRDRYEAEPVQAALRRRGVASVYYSRDSVFDTEEAADLLRILTALAEPDDEPALRAALCTGLLGTTAEELDALLQDELAWEALHEEMYAYHRAWEEQGFMAAFRSLLHARGVPHRLLRLEEGERRLTNLLQLAELIQNAGRDHHGIENLLHWFAEQCAAPNGESEDQQLRLESDEDLVKIVTIHKSKGLEYPVVFLPFLWGAKPLGDKRPPLFHADDGIGGLVLDLTRADEHYALAEKERLAEELRLVYVALTRARHLCYFAWGQFKEAARSALAWLLHSEGAADDVDALAARIVGLDDEELRARLEELAKREPGCLAVTDLPRTTDAAYRPPGAPEGALAARKPSRRVKQAWHMASFTGLTLNRFEPVGRPEYGSAREDSDARAAPEQPSIRLFPKGARAGTFMHQLFERLDFPDAAGETLRTVVETQLARGGYDAEWQPVVERMITDVLDTPLDDDGLSLRTVAGERRLVEMEFHYPLAGLTAEALNERLPGLGEGVETPSLRFSPVAGMMRGFIDLVFEHEGRFYLADYKSSYLGPRIEDYAPAALARAVAEHRYDLQYLIYTVALHRYLRHRIRGYDYERHFGGAYYLFLRGMAPATGAAYGVWFDRPPAVLIEDVDAIFGGGDTR